MEAQSVPSLLLNLPYSPASPRLPLAGLPVGGQPVACLYSPHPPHPPVSAATLSVEAPPAPSLSHSHPPRRLVACMSPKFRRFRTPSLLPFFALMTIHSPPRCYLLLGASPPRLPCCRARHPRAPCCRLLCWGRGKEPLVAKVSSGGETTRAFG